LEEPLWKIVAARPPLDSSERQENAGASHVEMLAKAKEEGAAAVEKVARRLSEERRGTFNSWHSFWSFYRQVDKSKPEAGAPQWHMELSQLSQEPEVAHQASRYRTSRATTAASPLPDDTAPLGRIPGSCGLETLEVGVEAVCRVALPWAAAARLILANSMCSSRLACNSSSGTSVKSNGEAIGVMTRAFSGTAATAPEGTTEWILGPSLREDWENPKRLSLMAWLMKADWACCLARPGFALGIYKDGNLGAVVVVLPYEKGIPSEMSNTVEILQAMRPLGLPPLRGIKDSKGIRARAFAAMDVLEQVKKKHCSGPHAHVRNMSVDPEAQGLGFCGKLMRAVNAWADRNKLPLWLETSGTRNVAIYERFGYKTMEQFALKCKNDPDIHQDEFGMMRLPEPLTVD
ncbi:unnamed protein product, partial [Effrenium voratum]